jgi:hypothetical protein
MSGAEVDGSHDLDFTTTKKALLSSSTKVRLGLLRGINETLGSDGTYRHCQYRSSLDQYTNVM